MTSAPAALGGWCAVGRARKTAPKICPGPERLKSTPIKRDDRVIVLDRRGEPEHETTVSNVGQHFVEVPSPTRTGCLWLVDPKRVVPIRIYGIAMAHVKARARMERYLAWLVHIDAPRWLIERARSEMSPHAAVRMLASARNLGWLARIVAARVLRGMVPWSTVARRLLASPEWLSLPWQADPETPTPARATRACRVYPR